MVADVYLYTVLKLNVINGGLEKSLREKWKWTAGKSRRKLFSVGNSVGTCQSLSLVLLCKLW